MTETHRMETATERYFSGIKQRFNHTNRHEIPQLWQKFNTLDIPDEQTLGPVRYGLCANSDDDGAFDYYCVAELPKAATLDGFESYTAGAGDYAVTATTANLNEIGRVMEAAFGWLGASELAFDNSRPVIERYGKRFNGRSGDGGFEIWLPVQPRS